MAGANPQRTSWVAEEVRGDLKPQWFHVLEPYIPNKVQVIIANDIIYLSTSKGVYAYGAANGEQLWVYPTDMPLGNSPTVVDNVLYVGGFDHNIHAIQAAPDLSDLPTRKDSQGNLVKINDQVFWTYEAEAGFDTNPLVVNDMVYVGNRDSYMYALYAQTYPDVAKRGKLAWKYKTGGPIHYSATYKDAADNKIYFAAGDMHGYALDAQTGALVWKTEKLPSGGFYSWWMALAGDYVVFPGVRPYRQSARPQVKTGDYYTIIEPTFTQTFGPEQADKTRDAKAVMQEFEQKPHLRNYYVFSTVTGKEFTLDSNNNGIPEYMPVKGLGTHSGSKAPAIVAPDNTIYAGNAYSYDGYAAGVAGWQVGDTYITTPSGGYEFNEPIGYAGGGNLIYVNLCCSRSAGAFDRLTGKNYWYFHYDLATQIPGYNEATTGVSEANAVTVYGGSNGQYGYHGDQNPPIPYKGKIYMHRDNALIAFSPGATPKELVKSYAVDVPLQSVAIDGVDLKASLDAEVQKILEAGHLKPGFFMGGGLAGLWASGYSDNFQDYFHYSIDTIQTLTLAYPHVSTDLQPQLRQYIDAEMQNFPPWEVHHIGWDSGASREYFDYPPEVSADMPDLGKANFRNFGFKGWGEGSDTQFPPYVYYGLWKYAAQFGEAKELFDNCDRRLPPVPSDAILAQYPFAHNGWIAGLWGYLELEKLAGYPESSRVRSDLNRLLELRAANFDKDTPWGPDTHEWHNSLNIARNFLYLTPELADYLRQRIPDKLQVALAEYQHDTPYWFVTNYEATYNELTLHHLYDYNALYAANAMILEKPQEALVNYLDVPAFARGDLFYIQNLVLALEAPATSKASTSLSQR
jgi:hypothetical protein